MSDDKWVPKVGQSYRFGWLYSTETRHVRAVVDGALVVSAYWDIESKGYGYESNSLRWWRQHKERIVKSFKTTNSLASPETGDALTSAWMPKVGYSYRVDFLAGAQTLRVKEMALTPEGWRVGAWVKVCGQMVEEEHSLEDWALWKRKGLIRWSMETRCVLPSDL